jgi:hypothetical protein
MQEREWGERWDPLGEVDGLSLEQRREIARAKAWELFLNGGGGEPTYFDYPTYLRNLERQR